MRPVVKRGLLALQALGLAVPAVGLAEWRLTGSNTLRVESYQVSGNEAYSPYAEEGLFSYNDLNLSLSGSPAPDQSLRIDFAGTYTDSPYRSIHQGLVPEVMRVVYDNSATDTPFRLDLGDQNVSLSPLTLDRTLKAARLTLWPQSGSDGRSIAANVFVGSNAVDWRELDFKKGHYRGLGVNVRDDLLGTVGFNLVNYSAEFDGLEKRQTVASLYARRGFDVAGQNLVTSGEWAVMRGQRTLGGERVSGQGGYLQLEGNAQNLPLSYRLRYDRYGEDFAPHGGNVIADSEGMLGEASWSFESGAQLRGSVSRLTEWRSSENPVDTDTLNIGGSSPLSRDNPGRGTVQVDAQLQKRQDEAGWVDSDSASLRVSARLRHDNGHSTQASAAVSRHEDHVRPWRDRRTRQASASHTLDLELRGTKIVVTPGVSVSQSRGGAGTLTVGPTLAVSAERDNHRLAMQIGQSDFDSEDPFAANEQTRLSLSYEMSRGRHRLGVEVDRQLREPEQGEETDAWRAGVYWRYDFDKSFGPG